LSNSQEAVVHVGTEFPAGKVVAIKKDGVMLKTPQGVKKFSFSQVERFVYDERSLSQA
jgi:hypothetical protein